MTDVTNGGKRVYGIGTVVVDHVLQLARFPDRDTKITIDGHWQQIGGPVPVALATFAFYGGNATFLGRWGDDAPGGMIRTGLAERGVRLPDTQPQADWSTGFAQVWTESNDGTRTIAYSRGEFPLPNATDVDNERLAECDILHLDGWAPDAAIHAAERVRASGGTVVLDAGSCKPRLDELLPLVNVLIASELFCRERFSDTDVSAEQLLMLGPPDVLITNGAAGATWISAERSAHQPAFAVNAVDTNGAGDIFAGAILYALSQAWSMDVGLKFAAAVAASACTQIGNATLPELTEVERMMAGR